MSQTNNRTEFKQYFAEYMMSKFKLDTYNLYPIESIYRLIDNYILTHEPEKYMTDDIDHAVRESVHLEQMIDKMVEKSSYSYQSLNELTSKTKGKNLPLFLTEEVGRFFSDTDLMDIISSEKFYEFYSLQFERNDLDVLIGKSPKQLEFPPLTILVNYLNIQYKVLPSDELSRNREIAKEVYMSNLRKYEQIWLDKYTIYDKTRFQELLFSDKVMSDRVNILMNDTSKETIQEMIYTMEELLKVNDIIKKSKFAKEDITTLRPIIEDFLTENELGTITIDDLLSDFLKEIPSFDGVFVHSDYEGRQFVIQQIMTTYLKNTHKDLTNMIHSNMIVGQELEDNPDMILEPEVPTDVDCKHLIDERFKKSPVFIHVAYLLRRDLHEDVYNILEKETLTTLDVRRFYIEFEQLIEDNTFSLLDLINQIDTEQLYKERLSVNPNIVGDYNDFLAWVTKNKRSLTETLNRGVKDTLDVFRIVEQTLIYFENTQYKDIDYSEEILVRTAMDDVFRWCSSMGITLDREGFLANISNNAEPKKDIEDIYLNDANEDNLLKELIHLFHSYVPRFTTNKRYTQLDRGYILDAIQKVKEHYPIEKSDKQLLMNIMAEKETLTHKTNLNTMQLYLDYLVRYVVHFIKSNSVVDVSYHDLDLNTQNAIELDMIDDLEELKLVLDKGYRYWVSYQLKNFYAKELRNLKEYDRISFEKSLSMDVMEQFYNRIKDLPIDNDEEIQRQFDIVHQYLLTEAEPYVKEAELNQSDRDIIESEIHRTVSYLNSGKSFMQPKISISDFYKVFGEDQLLEEKSQSLNETEFRKRIRTKLETYVKSEYEDEIKTSTERHFDPTSVEFTHSDKLQMLSNHIVRIVVLHEGNLRAIYGTRSHKYIRLYANIKSEYIQDEFENMGKYDEHVGVSTENDEDKLHLLDVQTGDFIVINPTNIQPFQQTMKVSGWVAFPDFTDGWYRVAFQRSPVRRFYTKKSPIVKSKLSNMIDDKINYEEQRLAELEQLKQDKLQREKDIEETERAFREREAKKLADQLKAEIMSDKEYKEVEDELEDKEDTLGQKLLENAHVAQELVVYQSELLKDNMSYYRETLFEQLLRIVHRWNREPKEETKLKAIKVDNERLIIQLVAEESVFFITPYFFIDGSYSRVFVDISQRIQLSPFGDSVQFSDTNTGYIKEIIQLIQQKETVSAKDMVQNSENDMQRLVRLKRVYQVQRQSLVNDTFMIKDNIDGSKHSHIEIHTYALTKDTNGKVRPVKICYVFAPSILYVKSTGKVLFEREGEGVNLNELNIILKDNMVGGGENKRRLFRLLQSMDMRRSVN